MDHDPTFTKSRLSSQSQKKLQTPHTIYRRDALNEHLTTFVDQSLEEVARLTGLKQKLQADIFDQCHNHQTLL